MAPAIEQLLPIVERARTLLPGLAEALHRQGRHEEAERSKRQARAFDDNDPTLWFGLGRSCQALGRGECDATRAKPF